MLGLAIVVPCCFLKALLHHLGLQLFLQAQRQALETQLASATAELQAMRVRQQQLEHLLQQPHINNAKNVNKVTAGPFFHH